MPMHFYRDHVMPNQQFPRTEIDGDARHPLHVEKDGSRRFPPTKPSLSGPEKIQLTHSLLDNIRLYVAQPRHRHGGLRERRFRCLPTESRLGNADAEIRGKA